MVDFRYHLVSIVAVFLALAVGIVLGTTQLNGRLLDGLNQSNEALFDDKRALQTDVGQLRDQVAGEEEAARMLAPLVVDRRLTGQRVVVVSTPDAPPQLREELEPLLVRAGATVGPQVRLQAGLLEPSSAALLEDLVAQAAVPGQELPEGTPLEQAMTQLAQVLVGRSGAVPPAPDVVQRVLAAYTGEDLVEVDGVTGAPATLAVLLTGPPPVDAPEDAVRPDRELIGLARALDGRGRGAVVAGPLAAAQDGGLLRLLREDASVSEQVTSVDGVDTARGRTAVVLGLQEQLAGEAGRYGTGPGADTPVPAPATP